MKRGLLIFLLLPFVYASECDNPSSDWIFCSDWKGSGATDGGKWNDVHVTSGDSVERTANPPTGGPGENALQVHWHSYASDDSNNYVEKNFNDLPNPFYSRVYFYSEDPSEYPGTGGRKFMLYRVDGCASAGVSLYLYAAPGNKDARLHIKNHAVGDCYNAPDCEHLDGTYAWPGQEDVGIIGANQWYSIEFATYRHNTDGWVKAWLDGKLVINSENSDTDEGCGSPGWLQIPSYRNGGSPSDHNEFVDNFIISSSYIGPMDQQTGCDDSNVCQDAVFCSEFEEGNKDMWDDYDPNDDSTNLLMNDPGPCSDAANTVMRLRVPPGRGVADLVKVLPGQYDKLYARWYQKWEPGYDFSARNHGGGLYAGARNLLGKSDYRPEGDDWFTTWLEPLAGTDDLAGRHNLYSYYRGMYIDCANPQGQCWGDHFPCMFDEGSNYCEKSEHRETIMTPKLETGRWYCLEIMLDAGTPVQNDADADGVQDFWIDGVEYGPFEHLWHRTTPDLKINTLWLSLFHHAEHSVEGVMLDSIVVSENRIGCLSPESYCGDGTCDPGETNTNCPSDCPVTGPVCGENGCEAGEDCINCPDDCECEPECVPMTTAELQGEIQNWKRGDISITDVMEAIAAWKAGC